MLGTAPVWRGVAARAHVACRDPKTTKGCGAFARAADEDGFPLASETTGVSGLAERYAAALFDLADERRILDEVASDLRQLRAMVEESSDLLRLIRSPILSRDQQSKGIEALAEAAGLSPLVRDFLAVVSVPEDVVDVVRQARIGGDDGIAAKIHSGDQRHGIPW